jgi:hypothetical protein
MLNLYIRKAIDSSPAEKRRDTTAALAVIRQNAEGRMENGSTPPTTRRILHLHSPFAVLHSKTGVHAHLDPV